MTFIIAFIITSFAASTFVVSACALSSRLSQREGLVEQFTEQVEAVVPAAKTVAPFSLN